MNRKNQIVCDFCERGREVGSGTYDHWWHVVQIMHNYDGEGYDFCSVMCMRDWAKLRAAKSNKVVIAREKPWASTKEPPS